MSKVDRSSYWQSTVQEQVASGVPIERWCKSQSINVHTFRHWRTRLNSAPSVVLNVESGVPVRPRVDWTEISSSTGAVDVEHRDGLSIHIGRVRVKVPTGFDPVLLCSILDLLETRC